MTVFLSTNLLILTDSSSNLLFNYNYIPCVISLQDKTGALNFGKKGDGIDITDGTITKDVWARS